MKRYLKNLLSALTGNNPYEAERDELAAKLEKAGENFRRLNELYYDALEKWEQEECAALVLEKRLSESDKQVASLQQLVENLRERIKDKDAAIKQYIIEVDALRGELILAQKKEISF